jgi:membrane protein YqaA with SNARE-associated domain
MFRKLYDWTLSLAQKRHATWALAGVSFAESSFFPIPPDALLVPMALAKPKRALFYATICTIASVAGGVLGYLIGWLLYDTIGHALLRFYGYADRVEALKHFYDEWGWAFILVKGVTPIPYKLVTIVSGLLDYNLALFVLLSAITRGARFFLVAGAMSLWGDALRGLFEKHFGLFIALVLIFVVAGFWLAARMF